MLSARSIATCSVMALAVACTRPNPEYCADTSECTNGLVCDQSTNRCIEAPVDAAQPGGDGRRCDPTAPFQAPVLQADLSSTLSDGRLTMTSDELTAILDRESSFVIATRSSKSDPFVVTPEPTPLAGIQAVQGSEYMGGLGSDGLGLYFTRTDIVPDPPTFEMLYATRVSTTSTFGEERVVWVDDMAVKGGTPQISRDGFTLYWKDPPTQQIYSAYRGSAAFDFDTGRVAATMDVRMFAVSGDELTLYYSQTDSPQAAAGDVFVTTRPSRLVPFEPGDKLTPVNTTADDAPVLVSDDGCLLYLTTNRGGGADIWASRRGH